MGDPETTRPDETGQDKERKRRLVNSYIALLQSELLDSRWKAAEALADHGDETAVEPLIAALNDPYVDVQCAWALGKMGDVRAVEPLIETLTDPKAPVRKDAAWALGKIGDDRAIAPLTALLQDNDDDVRNAAKAALETLQKKKSVPAP